MLRNQHTPTPLFIRTTLQAAVVALVAGSMTGLCLAQDGKEKDPKEKDPKAVQPATKMPVRPTVQPTGGGAKPGAANPKTSGGVTPPGKEGPKANTTPPNPSAPPATTPAVGPDGNPVPVVMDFPPPPPGWFRFEAFAEPVDVKLLVDMVADKLKIQIISNDVALRDKKIQLYTPVDVPEDKLLEFLGLLLEQNGQYIRKDPLGFYVIDVTQGTVPGVFNAESALATTQIIPTKGLKPTSLTNAIAQVLRGSPSAGTGGPQGAPPQINAQQGTPNVAYMDDLGVLVMTDTPRRIAVVKDLVTQLSDEQINLEFTRFEVKNLSASIAKQRMLEMLGQSTRTGSNPYNQGGVDGQQQFQNQQQQGLAGTAQGYTSSNLATRLVPDPQSNALTLRGRPEEIRLIQRLLAVVDVPNQLVPKWYAVGPAAQALADQGKRAGLGDVSYMQSTRGGTATGNQQNPGNVNSGYFPDESGYPVYGGGRSGQNQITNGPVFVIDADQRGFMYYGTPEQHQQLEKLVKEFSEITQSERVIYEFYKLKFVDAEKTSDLIRGLINNTVPGGESPLLPGAGGAANRGNRNSTGASMRATQQQPGAAANAGELGEIVASEDVFVLPDKSNNQVVVKAPQRLQPQFARLINKIDLRRPQVYIDAKIIVVNNREDFKLSVETSLVNAGGAGGALRTLFPGTTASSGNILTPPVVGSPSPVTGGISAAVILSDYVPIIINAMATTGSGRIVASPQLLVDDNEEAVISSIVQQPTTTTQAVAGSEPITSFGGYQDAGPKLTIKPRLSTGDLLSMKYELELSSFRGDSNANGVPPPKDVANIKSESVTLPSDSTIVVGGLELTQKDHTVVRVPLLGDIPIIGEAFKSTTDSEQKRTIYVFITPRIMRDPIGNDLRYISKRPAERADVQNELPPMKLDLVEGHGHSVSTRPVSPEPVVGEPVSPAGLGENNPTRQPARPTPMPGQEQPPAPPQPAPSPVPPPPTNPTPASPEQPQGTK